jgi:hypothetical protein
MVGYPAEYEGAMDTKSEDIGPSMLAIHELHKQVEHLHMVVDKCEMKFKPVLRSVPDKPGDGSVVPHQPVAEVTERLTDIGGALDRITGRLADMITRCEL